MNSSTLSSKGLVTLMFHFIVSHRCSGAELQATIDTICQCNRTSTIHTIVTKPYRNVAGFNMKMKLKMGLF